MNESDYQSKSEWVSQWASESISVRSCSDDPSSPVSSLENGGSGSRSRRRLPATPSDMATNANGTKGNNTENYLQDTLNVMEAMEARIGNEEKTRAGGQ